MADADAAVDALFAGDPDDFVAARNSLARQLRSEGQRQAAAAVAALRRPTVVAWTLNQIARREPAAVERLLAAGAALQAAQAAVLEHGAAEALRAASRERRAAVTDLVDRAAAVLATHGRAAHTVSLTVAVEAASTDPEVGELLRRGRLMKELEPGTSVSSWLGAGVESDLVAGPEDDLVAAGNEGDALREAPGAAAKREAERTAREASRAAEQARGAREAARAARQEMEEAEQEVSRLQSELDRARRRARTTAERASHLERDADDAEQDARSARVRADRTGSGPQTAPSG